MKRFIIVMVALIAGMTVAVAQSNTEEIPFKVELSRLEKYLKLRPAQRKIVKELNNSFVLEQELWKKGGSLPEQRIEQIIAENLTAMKETLSKVQFEKYVSLLHNTNKNKNVVNGQLFADLIQRADE